MPEGAVVSSRQFVTRNSVNYKLRLIQDRNEIQGQKVIVLNELTKQNISVSTKRFICISILTKKKTTRDTGFFYLLNIIIFFIDSYKDFKTRWLRSIFRGPLDRLHLFPSLHVRHSCRAHDYFLLP